MKGKFQWLRREEGKEGTEERKNEKSGDWKKKGEMMESGGEERRQEEC